MSEAIEDAHADTELRVYILLRGDIIISTGKAMAQAGHACVKLAERVMAEDAMLWHRYVDPPSSYAKITKKVPSLASMLRAQSECEKASIHTALITDAGRTEFTEPTVTVLAVGPVSRANLPRFVDRLRLL